MHPSPLVPAVVAGTLAFAAASVTASEAVSPGRPDGMAQIRAACPTFSWTSSPEAQGYELLVHRLSEPGRPAEEESTPALRQVLPAGAASWTPDDDRCLEPGGRYAWVVRPVDPDGYAPWSEPRFFSVADTPSIQEVSQALEVLRRYLGQDTTSQSPAATPESQLIREAPLDRNLGVGELDFDTARAAVRGELPETSGETFGVAGRTNSPDGAGVAAANASGGADLVLDGSIQELADTILTESGIDRPSASDQTFEFANTGTGSMALEVDGTVSVASTDTVAVDVSGGIQAGTGNVGIVGGDGRIPEITSTFFADLDGSNLTGINASNADALDGLDSTQFLRSDASDTFTGGSLTLAPGTTLQINGALETLATAGTNSIVLRNTTQAMSNNDSPKVSFNAFDSTDTQRSLQLHLRTAASGYRLRVTDGNTELASLNDTGDFQADGVLSIDGLGTSNFAGMVSATSATLVSSIQLTAVSDASGSSPGACGGGTIGTVYYDSEENLPCFCDGTNYVYITDAVTTCTP